MYRNVVSLPSSGRSWLRIVIGKLHTIKDGTSDRDVFYTPNYFFKHRLDNNSGKYLFLLRDPRDLLVSSFYQYRYRPSKNSKLGEISFSEFIRRKVGVPTVLKRFNTWHHYCDGNPMTEVAYYEDLVDSPVESFSSILNWFEEEVTPEQLGEALEFAQFDNLRQLSKEQYFTSDFLNARDPDDERTYKFRTGKVGSHKNFISEEDMEYIVGELQGLKWSRYHGLW